MDTILEQISDSENTNSILEENADLLERLSTHLEGRFRSVDLDLAQDLSEVFQEFIYEGIACRAVGCEWDDTKPHISWSKKQDGAIFAYKSNNNGRQNYWMYETQVIGFDVKKFIDSFGEEIEKYIDTKILMFADHEFEIISLSYSREELELIG